MDFSLTEEQTQIRDMVRSAITDIAGDAALASLIDEPTGYIPQMWNTLANAGLLGLSIPERFGGSAASLYDVALVMEEYGRAPLPELFMVATAVSPAVLLALATDGQKTRWLTPMADGEHRVTVAIADSGMEWHPDDIAAKLTEREGRYVLNGRKIFVPDLAGSTHMLVAAQIDGTDRIAVVMLDSRAQGITSETLEGLISWQTAVTLENVVVEADALLGESGVDAGPGLQQAMLGVLPLVCAYQVGSCQAVYEMSLLHCRTRIQFGQPIGRFQRVQDHVIDLINHLDAARWSTNEAVWRCETGQEGTAASVHMAKSVVGEAHWEACNWGHEVHAGLGSDLQYGLARHTMLSRSLYHFMGEPRWHREQMAVSLGW